MTSRRTTQLGLFAISGDNRSGGSGRKTAEADQPGLAFTPDGRFGAGERRGLKHSHIGVSVSLFPTVQTQVIAVTSIPLCLIDCWFRLGPTPSTLSHQVLSQPRQSATVGWVRGGWSLGGGGGAGREGDTSPWAMEVDRNGNIWDRAI